MSEITYTKYNIWDVNGQEAGAKTPASCISGTVVIPHKGGFMSKATAFTLGFVTGAAALGAATYMAKSWTSEADDEAEEDVSPPINETTDGENGTDTSARQSDVLRTQESGDPDATEVESSPTKMPTHQEMC